MNSGEIITTALQRTGMAVNDYSTRMYALTFLNEICQEYYSYCKGDHRISTGEIVTASGTDEYSLSKYCSGAYSILKDSMRGTDPIRKISYKPAHQFYRDHPYEIPSEDPFEYRPGQKLGIALQPSASSQISVASSYTSISSGTVSVIYGSNRIVFSTGVLSVDNLGAWLWVGTDSDRYQVAKIDSTTVAYLSRPYEGATSATASYKLGDESQKVTVMGYLNNGELVEEEMRMNGATSVTSTNSFQALIKVSKSDKTVGRVRFTSSAGVVVNADLDPGETEAQWTTIKFYPIPNKVESITYDFFMLHPVLYKHSDSPLIPQEYHNLLTIELYIRLMTEHLGKDVSTEVTGRRNTIRECFLADQKDTDNWDILQESDENPSRNFKGTNLPTNYPYDL